MVLEKDLRLQIRPSIAVQSEHAFCHHRYIRKIRKPEQDPSKRYDQQSIDIADHRRETEPPPFPKPFHDQKTEKI